MIPNVSDIHTHNPDAVDAVINLTPAMTMRPDALYSVGIHPWQLPDEETWQWVERMALHSQVVMIGECGIDRLRSPLTIDRQEQWLLRHIALSERVEKPLLLHIVRAYAEILRIHRITGIHQPWIIHGFRGKIALATQLLAAGFHLSLAANAPTALLDIIPPDRLHRESD